MHSTRADRGSSTRKNPRCRAGSFGGSHPHIPLGVGGRAAYVAEPQSLVTTSSSRVLTGPWYLFFAEIRYQPPKIAGIRIASGV
jgi:hypothetical protein